MAEQPTERSPLIPHGEAPGALPRSLCTSSAPPNLVVSPGSGAYNLAISRRTRDLRRAKGTGRTVPIPGQSRSSIVVTPKSSRGEEDKDDPISSVRAAMPYQRLQEENPGVEITRRAMTEEDHRRLASDNHREKYYGRLNRAVRAHVVSQTASEDEIIDAADMSTLVEVDEDDYDPFVDFLIRPDHVIPADFYRVHNPLQSSIGSSGGSQSSLVTILSLWNTMMGTSLLAMPWAISKAGLIAGPALSLLEGIIALATAVLVLKLHKKQEVKLKIMIPEFPQLAGTLVNKKYGFGALLTICSILAVTGACAVYWMLMTNFLYNTGKVIRDASVGIAYPSFNNSLICAVPEPTNWTNINSSLVSSSNGNGGAASNFFMLAPGGVIFSEAPSTDTLFDQIWTPHTVALLLVLLVGPIICINSVTFFAKFNSIGTLNVFFLIGIVIYFASQWGFNVNVSDDTLDTFTPMIVPSTCFCLTGTLALGLFIHNAIITIMRNNEHQEKNVRDATIGFSLVLGTYLLIGFLYYTTFPLRKSCIADNFLNNFHQSDLIVVLARAMMLLQLFAVFPLVMYILRSNIVQVISRNPDVPNRRYLTYIINGISLVFFVLVTIFVPTISTVIRFAGAGCGMMLIFVGPIGCHVAFMYRTNTVCKKTVAVEVVVVLLGVVNFALQFMTA